MKLLTLDTYNFKVLNDRHTFTFEDGITGIVGVNGAGKSTLINAIAFALYGPEVLKTSTTDIPTWGEKKAESAVRFELNGDQYICTRSLNDATLMNGDIIKAQGREPVTKAVTELLGVDRDGFLVSVFARQNELLYLSSEPDKRMRTILKLLRISQITKAIKSVRDQANIERKALAIIRAQQPDVDAINGTITDLLDEQKTIIGKLEGVTSALEVENSVLDNLQSDQAKISVHRAEVEALSNEYQAQSLSFKLAIGELTQRRAWVEKNRETLIDYCPTCRRPFDNLEHIEQERTRMRMEMEGISKSLDQIHEESTSVLGELSARIDAAKLELIGADTTAAIQTQNNKIIQLTSQLGFYQSRHQQIETALAEKHDQLEAAKQYSKKIKDQESAVSDQDQTAVLLQSMKESLIGRIIPFLNERTSQLVERMTDGKFTEVQLTNDYDIQYRNSLGDLKGFNTLSGGEQVVFALALRLAISDLRADSIGCLFLDEVLSSLSSEDGRDEQVWMAIENLRSKYNQILMITHVAAFKDRAENVIRIGEA